MSYRTSSPILEPQTAYERDGHVGDVVFPSATDLLADGALDVCHGAADHVIAEARPTVPNALPGTTPSSLPDDASKIGKR